MGLDQTDAQSRNYSKGAWFSAEGPLPFDMKLKQGVLDRPFIPQKAPSSYVGLVLTIVGLGVALCVRPGSCFLFHTQPHLAEIWKPQPCLASCNPVYNFIWPQLTTLSRSFVLEG
jgi:hypothetical protein